MRRLALVLGLIALAGGLGLLLSPEGALQPSPALTPDRRTTGADEPEAPHLAGVGPGDAERDRQLATAALEPPLVEPGIAPSLKVRPARITGRFVFPQGNGIPGVYLVQSNAHGGSEDLGVSAADGRFELEIQSSKTFPLELEAQYSGHVVPRWSWERIAPGAAIDLGTLVLVREALLRVRVLDKYQRPFPSELLITARAAVAGTNESKPSIESEVVVAPGSGECLLEGLPPEWVSVTADSRHFGPIASGNFKLSQGIVNEFVLMDCRERDDFRILVALPGPEALGIQVYPRDVLLKSADGHARHPGERESWDEMGWDGLAFENLEMGQYEISVVGDRWEPWSQSGVWTGTRVEPEFIGRASVVFDVVDKATGEAILNCSAMSEERRFAGLGQMLLDYALPAHLPLRVTGVVPGEHAFTVTAPGYAPCHLPLVEIPTDQETTLRFELERGATLRGRVALFDGRVPTEAIDVRLALPVRTSRPDRDGNGDGVPDRPERVAWQTFTDRAGVFEFTGLQPGEYAVRAEWNAAVSDMVTTKLERGQTGHVRLTLPGRSRLKGRVLFPESASLEGLQLALVNRDVQVATVLQSSGEFDVIDVAPGDYKLSLLIPVRDQVDSPSGESPSFIPLGSTMLVDSKTTEVVLDARERFPGSLRFELTLPEGWSRSGEARLIPRSVGAVGRIGASMDRDGRFVFARVPPGDWGVTIDLHGLEENYMPPRTFRVKPGGDHVERIQLEPSRASLQFRVRGKVLPEGATVAVDRLVDGKPRSIGAYCAPNTEGRASLGLLPGRYRLEAYDASGEELGTAIVEWTSNGPAGEVVDLR